MLTTLLAVTLAGAPLSVDDGEFLGWTKDGESFAWVGTVPYLALSAAPQRVARVVEVRNVVSATGDTFELESHPPGVDTVTKGPDAARWEAWLAAHPLVKLEALDGAKAVVKADGKATTTFGGASKAVKLELSTEKAGVRHTAKSLVVEHLGKTLGKATVRPFFEPTGRRVVFVLDVAGAIRTTELIEADLAPTVFVWTKKDVEPAARREHELAIERAGFVATGGDTCERAGSGVTITTAASNASVGEQLAKALGGTRTTGPVNRQLSDVIARFDCAP
jgi:hypothetical protein